ncbi:MAG TPA: glucose 1-dehydrogenase [Chloroflexota bacterium]|nr:glucose 1-dehydrogenase [Chloroflexota bacterium]
MAGGFSMDVFRLDGRAALVTGGSSGLGVQIAQALLATGAKVMLAARREEVLAQRANELRCSYRVCDVSVEAERQALIEHTVKEFCRVDVLVNNAGMNNVQPAVETSAEAFERVLGLNLVAPFALSRLAAQNMMERDGGSIINVASILGMVGVGQIPDAGYAASKGGLVNLTRELAAQWARKGVRVNAIAPGFFPSEMTVDMFGDERSLKWLRSKDPMGRGGRDGELGGAVVFLASDASSYVTGHILAVDGGWTAV